MDDYEQIAEYIRKSIAENSFEIHYQPQFCLVSSCFEVTGVEALLRPDTTVCHIERLIQVAIGENLISELGFWVMGQVAHQLRVWVDTNLVTTTFTASVNVTGEQLQDESFCATLHQIVNDAEIRPEQLTLELVESSMIDDNDIAKIYHLSAEGFNISIDDFGTGYSSFETLVDHKIDELKMDKSLIDTIQTKKGYLVCKNIVNLCHELGSCVVAEGVETKEQKEFLLKNGCEKIQGYFYSKPIPADDMEVFLKKFD